MSFKKVTNQAKRGIVNVAKEAWAISKPTAKAAVDNFMGAVLDVGYAASKYYTSSYTKELQEYNIVSALESAGTCMRQVYQCVRQYGENNPYAFVEKEVPGRLSKDNTVPLTTNGVVMTETFEKELEGIKDKFRTE